jgi:ABC-type transport system involved in multi-copper enzyme maturation permease subunit
VDLGGEKIDMDRLVLGFEAGFSGFLYMLGTFLALFATAHLVPRLQEKGTVDLYLSRPVGRTKLLLSRYFGGLLLAAANLLYLMGSIWAIVAWKTGVGHPRFLLGGLVILFAIGSLLAFAFLVGVATSSTAVSLMVTYAVFFFAALLSEREKIAAAVSSETSAGIVRGLYWIFPKTAELGRATVGLVSSEEAFFDLGRIDLLPVFGSTALFGLLSLALAARLFARKDF